MAGDRVVQAGETKVKSLVKIKYVGPAMLGCEEMVPLSPTDEAGLAETSDSELENLGNREDLGEVMDGQEESLGWESTSLLLDIIQVEEDREMRRQGPEGGLGEEHRTTLVC